MKIYKLTSIEKNQDEVSVELNENQMEIIYRALREVSDMIFDEDDVYYSKEAEKERVSNNVPGYSQLYDVQSFPTLYLLDKDKRIVAKKLSFEQIDEILQLKLKEKAK